jgi:phage host-nuclease inhibitor protein Gam
MAGKDRLTEAHERLTAAVESLVSGEEPLSHRGHEFSAGNPDLHTDRGKAKLVEWQTPHSRQCVDDFSSWASTCSPWGLSSPS